MAGEQSGEDRRAFFGHRHEQPQAPGDDLGDEAERFQDANRAALGEAGQFTRVAPMLSERRNCNPPARSITAPRSSTAVQASAAERGGASDPSD